MRLIALLLLVIYVLNKIITKYQLYRALKPKEGIKMSIENRQVLTPEQQAQVDALISSFKVGLPQRTAERRVNAPERRKQDRRA